MALAIIGGMPERFAPLVALYREMVMNKIGRERGRSPITRG